MDKQGQTSFIPKRPESGSLVSRPKRARSMGLINIIAGFLLVAALLFYGGSWFYRGVLADEINRPCQVSDLADEDRVQRCGLRATVEREQQNLPQNTILLLQRLDHKFKIADDLLGDHLNILPVFAMLEELTLPSIYYDRFDYGAKGLSLSGQAASYEDIAIQTRIFSEDIGRIESFIFSDLNSNDAGRVTFRLTMILDQALASYHQSLVVEPPPPPTPPADTDETEPLEPLESSDEPLDEEPLATSTDSTL
ncbi:MAG: hypothetical protein U9M92_03350 [Patescibacteria group bacterium]|nr:hypothetical protein [Patescibacteria group bacterium]